MNDIDLIHFGDQCAPGIIINHILQRKKKELFMLGIFSFNNIINYLLDNNYEKIYDKDFLKIWSSSNYVSHIYYDFGFNHDYKTLNNEITNYDFVKNRFDEKISNFREMLKSPNKSIFINFTNNVDNLKINDLLKWLESNKPNFHIIIYTNNNYKDINYKNVSIIKLDNNYNQWWTMTPNIKYILYEEIYTKFIECIYVNKIEHNFPNKFNETYFGKIK
jgi:hypothetical protein